MSRCLHTGGISHAWHPAFRYFRFTSKLTWKALLKELFLDLSYTSKRTLWWISPQRSLWSLNWIHCPDSQVPFKRLSRWIGRTPGALVNALCVMYSFKAHHMSTHAGEKSITYHRPTVKGGADSEDKYTVHNIHDVNLTSFIFLKMVFPLPLTPGLWIPDVQRRSLQRQHLS